MKIYTCGSYKDLTWLPFRINYDCKKMYIYIIQSVFLTRKCEENARTTSFLLFQKEWTYSMFSSLLGFRSLSSIPDKITGVLRSILWSFQVFERRRPPEMSLEWINHQMIKWSIFSRPTKSTSQNESTSSPYFFWAKVDFENHRLKSGISGRKICFFAGCFVFFCVSHRIISEGIWSSIPIFVQHLKPENPVQCTMS